MIIDWICRCNVGAVFGPLEVWIHRIEKLFQAREGRGLPPFETTNADRELLRSLDQPQ
jgi:hypothetical protein